MIREPGSGSGAGEAADREAEDIRAVVEASRRLLDDGARPVQRGQHPKMHGCVRAEFVVDSRISDEHREGVFAEPGRSYPAWIRFSNGSQTDDRRADAHGLAIKLVGVGGAGPADANGDGGVSTQDFVLVDHPRFFIRNPAEYAGLSRAMVRAAGKGDSDPLARRMLGFLPDRARMLATLVLTYFFPLRLGSLARMIEFVGQKPRSPLASRYWSTTPYRFGGDRFVKYSAKPRSTLAVPSPPGPKSRDFLREVMAAQLADQEVIFDFQVQFHRDDRTTPIEDPTVEWLESAAPPVTLASIVIRPQRFDTPEQRAFGDALSFSPAHALEAHRPAGGINRTREAVYTELADLRRRDNGWPTIEPTPDDGPGGRGRVARDPTSFGEVLERELKLIHARRRALFPGEADAEPPAFDPMPDEDRRVAAARAEALRMRASGVAISGGGIRSGTFAVGFLQGLASVGLLKRIDYLSTVSGGGYAGGWLAGWIERNGDVRSVESQLATSRVREAQADRLDLARGSVVEEEPEPIRHLRAYSSYLFPQPGLLRPDTWTVLMIWARNVLINLAMLFPRALGYVALARLMVYLFAQTNRAWIDGGPDGWAGWALAAGFAAATTAILLLALGRVLGCLREFRYDDPRYRPAGTRAWSLLGPIVTASVLVALMIRWALSLISAALDRALSSPLPAVKGNGVARFAWDYVGTHLDLLDPPNVLGHLAVISIPMGLMAYRAARRKVEDGAGGAAARRPSAGQPAPAGTFARAAVFSGGTAAILLVLLEALIRRLDGLDRPDLMAMLAPPSAMMIFVVGMIVVVALLGRAIGEAEREWWSRLGALLTLVAVRWAGGAAIIYYGPGLIYAGGSAIRAAIATGWLGTAGLAVLTGRYVLPNLKGRAGGLSLTWLASAASVVFLAGFVGLVGLTGAVLINVPSLVGTGSPGAGTFAYYLRGVQQTGLASVLLLAGVSFVLSGLAARFVDVNLFSLHAMYVNRLVRCYLGASRPLDDWAARWLYPRDTRSNVGAPGLRPVADGHAGPPPRNPNPISGFDPEDDLPLLDLRFDAEGGYQGPLPLINATLNLVEGHDLAWRDRKGESFTLSPLFCGSKGLGYALLGEGSRPNLTLGRAMAISGAAIDPNMSLYQSTPLTALLTIFNARLGYWVARPRPAPWDAASPKFGDLLMTEFLGRTDGSRDFVHLSDGGHFENLGVYELVRRRCRSILVLDAGSDGTPNDDNLATLIRLCRVDFGVSIDLDAQPIRVDDATGMARSHAVAGRINYADLDPDAPSGVLIYVKISLTGDEPPDVLQYAKVNDAFPHQATDFRQSFDESQFESYRRLGEHIANRLFEPLPQCVLRSEDLSFDEYNRRVYDGLKDRWSARSQGRSRPSPRFTEEWPHIQREMSSDPRLADLDRELFPELPRPDDEPARERARTELHMVVRMLRLMEDQWRELGLDGHATLPLDQGWMNSFRRWAGAEPVRRLWPTLASTFAPGFVRFCRERLGLSAGESRLVPVPDVPSGFVADAVALIAREFGREYPGPGGAELLARQVEGSRALGLAERPCWLIAQGGPGMLGEVACGIVVASATGPVDAATAFLVWMRPAFRESGLARDVVREAVREATRLLAEAGRDATLSAAYPSDDPDDVGLAEWIRFHRSLDFVHAPQPKPTGTTTMRRGIRGPKPAPPPPLPPPPETPAVATPPATAARRRGGGNR